MIIDKKHIILFWILGLILFTFYCIFRIKHIREKYDDIKLDNKPKTIIDHINNIQGKNKQISLEDILKRCPHPRATFFRCLKKLRTNNYLKVLKDNEDARKSYISVSPKFSL